NVGLASADVLTLAAVGTTVYAVTSGDNLLRSADGGASWQQAAALAFNDPYTRLAGGGDLVAAVSGNRMWVSTDAGKTFGKRMLSSPGATYNLEVLESGSVILAATSYGVVRSTDAGATFNAVQGI